ncbi:unnamed protein product [Spirodela intermedia]|uniref:Auxin response factor n=1 Tax=Spirodela intermedia TaxID=51605 RepID=A0A7I8KW65_SPIIN|nr:unnamed protein product [Spirodela intermedia]
MKAPSTGFSANPTEEAERKNINSELWHACAGPLVSIPPVGSLVVYFPQGHSEQVAASMQKDTDSIPSYPSLPSKLICLLHNVTLHADPETDEVYAEMTLQPVSKCDREAFLASDLGLKQNRQPSEFFCKTLTASDTSTHGGFSVPRRAAEKIFPPLDFSMQPPAQELSAKDLHDASWTFRHIYRGQPKRHLLTTGWSVFVGTKRLLAGDSVLFVRDEKSQLLLGVRRAVRQPPSLSSSVLSSDSMHIGILAAAAHAAANNSPFTIFYNPRATRSEFVIPLAKYYKAVYTQVSVGMRFRMMFETEESGIRRYMGTITGISDLDPDRWRNSQWRNLQVGWDESATGERRSRVSVWEIEPVATPFYLCSPFFRPKLPRLPGILDEEGEVENGFKRGGGWLGEEGQGPILAGLNLMQWMSMQQGPQSMASAASQAGLFQALVSSGAFQGGAASGDDPSRLLNFQPQGSALPNPQPPPLRPPPQQALQLPQQQQQQQLLQPLVMARPPPPQQQMMMMMPPLHIQQQQQQQQQSQTRQVGSGVVLLDHQQQQMVQAQTLGGGQAMGQNQQQQQVSNQLLLQALPNPNAQAHQNAYLLNQNPPQTPAVQLQQQLEQQRLLVQQQQLVQQIQLTQPQFQLQLLQKLQQQQQVLSQLSPHLQPQLPQSSGPLQGQLTHPPPPPPPPPPPLQEKPSGMLLSPTSPKHQQYFKPQIEAPLGLPSSKAQPGPPLMPPAEPPAGNLLHELRCRPDPCIKNEAHSAREAEHPTGYRHGTTDHLDASSSATSFCLDGGAAQESFSLPPLCLDSDIANVGLSPDALLLKGFSSGRDLQGLLMAGYGGSQRDPEPEISSQSFGVPGISFRASSSGEAAAVAAAAGPANENGALNRGPWPGQQHRMRTYTKVQKRGSVGRCIDVTRYKGYGELRRDLAAMFGIEGQLEDPHRTDWKLVYVDHENDILLVGDDPWEEFVSCVQSIKILSAAEVQQMSLDNLVNAPVDNPACSGSDNGNLWKGHYDDNSGASFGR